MNRPRFVQIRVQVFFSLLLLSSFGCAARNTSFEMAEENAPVQVSGKVYQAVYEYAGGLPAKKSYILKTLDSKTVPLSSEKDDLKPLADGKTEVIISGLKKQNTLSIQSASANILQKKSLSPNALTAKSMIDSKNFASGTRSLLLILFNFPNNQDTGLTLSAAHDLVYNNTQSMNGFYLAQSFNKMSLQTDVIGYYTVSSSVTTSCDPMAWASDIANQAISQYGPDQITSYETWGFISRGNTICGGMVGLAYIGVGEFWINGDDSAAGYRERSLTHEYGHTLGLDHAHLSHCVDASNNAVPISSNCTQSDTGDAFDGMSYEDQTSLKHFSGPAKAFLGWIPSSQITTISANTSSTYNLIPLEIANGSGIYMLQIKRSDGQYYYVDFRQPNPSDPFEFLQPSYATGVEIHLAGDLSEMPEDITLINNNPGNSAGAYVAPVSVGQTFSDPSNALTIKTLSVSSTGAQVQVTLGTNIPATPSIPTNLTVRQLQ